MCCLFRRHYELIYNKCRSLINDNEKNYEITKSKSKSNICFSPGIIELLYAVLPLWSGIILSGVNTKENWTTTDSDTSVENWFKIVKHRILNSEWTEN